MDSRDHRLPDGLGAARRRRHWFELGTSGALLVLPVAHPFLEPILGPGLDLFWLLHVIPVAILSYRFGWRGAGAAVLVGLGLLVVAEVEASRFWSYAVDAGGLFSLGGQVGITTALVAGLSLLAKWGEEQNRRLSAIPREGPDPILELDRRGCLVYANPAAEALMRELRAGDFESMLPERHPEVLAAALQAKVTVRKQERRVAGRVLSWTYSSRTESGHVRIHGHDVTDRTRVEKEPAHDALHDALTGWRGRSARGTPSPGWEATSS